MTNFPRKSQESQRTDLEDHQADPARDREVQRRRGRSASMARAGTREDAIRGLAGLTGNCVACHAVYRLDEAW